MGPAPPLALATAVVEMPGKRTSDLWESATRESLPMLCCRIAWYLRTSSNFLRFWFSNTAYQPEWGTFFEFVCGGCWTWIRRDKPAVGRIKRFVHPNHKLSQKKKKS